ncbi:MAG: hypothetical protein J0M34_05900 [Alphaproteobacteria bacterium]|nr:hypothetical protein [Alphaproteobacteria bacterium]
MRSINLTVIADRSCSTSRTYLEYLRAAGLKPKHLWLVDFGACSLLARLKPMKRTMPAPFLSENAAYRELCMNIQREAGVTPTDYFAQWEPQDYAEEITYFRARDFDDVSLQARMKKHTDTAFLYTNGGILPAAILNAPDVRVLHIHPGIVPDVRGSDCLLWSVKLRNKIGVSCFYMSAGIDEGDLIAQHEWDIPKLPSLAAMLNPREEDMGYRALLYALDPHYRAQLLIKAIGDATDLRNLASRPQPKASRSAYLWLHPRLRLKFMREAFL